jgi:histidinol-phosphate aminotransferase
MSLTPFLRADIDALEAYTPIVPLDVLAARLGMPAEHLVKLDANENPYGPSAAVLEVLAGLGGPAGALRSAIYPDPESGALRDALAHYTGQPATRIVCGAGSDELIDLTMRLCLTPGDVMLDCPPTFGVYAFDAALYGARVVEVPRDAAFDIDVAAIEAAARHWQARLLFLPAPNNPTGNPLARAAILRLLELPLLLVIDEAYYEFAGETVADLVADHPNLVVLRTFSKWAGLAGLRVGYGIWHDSVVRHLWKIKQPYNVNVAAQLAAVAALGDLGHQRRCVARILAERERVRGVLADIPGLTPLPSAANFLLCRVSAAASTTAAARAAALRDGLMRRGILIRYFRKPRLDDHIRITIGTPEQNDRVLAALRELLTEE